MPLPPFHVAISVRDISESRHFYAEILGCQEGRSAETWVDFNLFGHQFVCHLNPNIGQHSQLEPHYNLVDGQGVPVPHYGVVLTMDDWEKLAAQLKAHKIDFVIEPSMRFQGEVGEQATMFFLDPSGNALEFKAFKQMEQLFAS